MIIYFEKPPHSLNVAAIVRKGSSFVDACYNMEISFVFKYFFLSFDKIITNVHLNES